MLEMKLFENEEFGSIRTVVMNNEVWFCAKDVAVALGYKNPKDAVKNHVDEEDKQLIQRSADATLENNVPFNIPNRGLTFINESGLYALVLGSNIPSAKKFKRWLTKEVIPSIRQNGMYATEELLDNPDLLIKVATKLKEERQARLLAEQQAQEAQKIIEEQQPKVDFHDKVADSSDLLEWGNVAKALGKKKNLMLKELRDRKVLQTGGQNQNIPYQTYIDRGYFNVKEVVKGNRICFITRVTGKGQIWLSKKFTEWEAEDRNKQVIEFKRPSTQPKVLHINRAM